MDREKIKKVQFLSESVPPPPNFFNFETYFLSHQ
jgi:hypothetical protein